VTYVLLARLQASDVTRHLLLADGQPVYGLPHVGKIARHHLQLAYGLPQVGEIARHHLERLLHLGRGGWWAGSARQ
jgi:hypothetical protein